MDYIMNNQDLNQKINVCFNVSIELFRVLISSLLILSVPQNCDGHVCNIVENIYTNNDNNYLMGLIINFSTTFAFFIMYICEIRREEKLIKLLEVNNNISTDSESINRRMEILEPYKKEQLYNVSLYYCYSSYFAIVMFIFNSIISGIIINKYSLGNQTQVNFVTNILFMISKLIDVYMTINTETNIFYSAYLTTKVQFNDIDPRELAKINDRNILKSGELLLLRNRDTDDTITIQTNNTGSSISKLDIERNDNELCDYLPSDSDTGSDDIETRVLKVIFREPEIYSNPALLENCFQMKRT